MHAASQKPPKRFLLNTRSLRAPFFFSIQPGKQVGGFTQDSAKVQRHAGLQQLRGRKKVESRSVSRVLSRTVIPLRRTSLHAFSNLPGSSAGHADGTLFGLAPSGVYLATDCCQPCGALLPHLFTLTGACALRRLFSVALSVGSRLPGVTWHSALWSPDFPPPSIKKAATVRSTLRRQG